MADVNGLLARLRQKQVPRFWNSTGRPSRLSGYVVDPDCQEAAEEIERLRAQLAQRSRGERICVKCGLRQPWQAAGGWTATF